MKFSVFANELNAGMGMAVRALSPRPSNPIYDGIFIETNDEGICLTCTNSEMTIKAQVNATIVEEGCALLPARLFHELIKKQEGTVSIDTNINTMQVIIEAEGSKTEMMCMDATNFPDIQMVSGDFVTTVSQKKLSNAISRIAFALSSDETRRILTGCLMEVYSNEVRFVCLDGFRLGMYKIYDDEHPQENSEHRSAIIPGPIMIEFARMMGDTDESVEIICSKTHMMASFNQVKVFSPLIPGEYIDYKQILPSSWTTAVKVNRSSFIVAVERAALIAREGNNLLRLQLENDQITISANTELGSATEKVGVTIDGMPLKIAFNAKYLLDVVRNVDTTEMTMRFNTNVSPCVISPVKGDQFTYLVLPVRTVDQISQK